LSWVFQFYEKMCEVSVWCQEASAEVNSSADCHRC